MSLKSRLVKITDERRMIAMFNIANIHKTKVVKLLIKIIGWVVFNIPLYLSELNKT